MSSENRVDEQRGIVEGIPPSAEPPIKSDIKEEKPSIISTIISTIKDITGIVQNLFAIGAIIGGFIWFSRQGQTRPTISTTVLADPVVTKDGFDIAVNAVFKNTGHVPFYLGCWGIGLVRPGDKTPPPPEECPKETIYPNEEFESVMNFKLPIDEDGKKWIIMTKVGKAYTEREEWDQTAPTSIKQILLSADHSTQKGGSIGTAGPLQIPSSLNRSR